MPEEDFKSAYEKCEENYGETTEWLKEEIKNFVKGHQALKGELSDM